MSLDLEGAAGDVLADLAEVREVLGVDGQLVDTHVIGSVFGMGPSEDGVGGGMEDVLGVGTGEVGGERNVEGVVDDGHRSIEWLR